MLYEISRLSHDAMVVLLLLLRWTKATHGRGVSQSGTLMSSAFRLACQRVLVFQSVPESKSELDIAENQSIPPSKWQTSSISRRERPLLQPLQTKVPPNPPVPKSTRNCSHGLRNSEYMTNINHTVF